MSNTRRPRGLREVLKKRQVRTTHYDLPLVPFDEAQKLSEDLTLAKNTVKAAEFLLDREDRADIREGLAAARDAEKAAQAAYDACFHRIVFVGLPEDELDALVQLHPPTPDQVAAAGGDDVPMWDEETFFPALLEHCAQESELSAAEWAVELKGWTRGDKAEIRSKVLEVNIRSFSAALSFG